MICFRGGGGCGGVGVLLWLGWCFVIVVIGGKVFCGGC